MEVEIKSSFKDKLAKIIFKEKSYFLNRREINWKSISKCALIALAVGVVGILLIPAPSVSQGEFHERAESNRTADESSPAGNDPTSEALAQLNSNNQKRSSSQDLGHLYSTQDAGGPSESANGRDTTMILARGGLDAKTQLPPGSRLSVRLYENAIVTNQGMPVIGVVTQDFINEDSVAVPQGSKLFGMVTFEDTSERAKVDWGSIQFPDGRERQLTAIGVGSDGQVGVAGRLHSDALKNTVGQTLTRFIGAYAEGSMQRGALGSNNGGNDNGWKNAIAETARDRADTWANDLKKEKKWIELSNSTDFYAVLTTNFAFRDPGATYGR